MSEIVEIDACEADQRGVEDAVIRSMYDLLGSNMTRAVGGSGSDWQSPDEYRRWKETVFLSGLQGGTRHILMRDERGLRGFISYAVPGDSAEIYLNEFQIRDDARRDGVTFRRLFERFMDRIDSLSHTTIRTYSNNSNPNAQSLITRLGFTSDGVTNKGARYIIAKRDLRRRLAGIRRG